MSQKPRNPLLAWHQLAAESVAGKEAMEKGLAGFLRKGSRKAKRKLEAAIGRKVQTR